MEIKSAALIGVGAVGSYFAYGLPAKLGDRFCVIASGKRKERLEKEISRGKGILSNAGFLAKAPEAKVQAEKNKLADYEKQFEAVCARLNLLQNK